MPIKARGAGNYGTLCMNSKKRQNVFCHILYKNLRLILMKYGTFVNEFATKLYCPPRL